VESLVPWGQSLESGKTTRITAMTVVSKPTRLAGSMRRQVSEVGLRLCLVDQQGKAGFESERETW
jgi:hypothetical protein